MNISNTRLPAQDSSTGRAIKTFIFACIGFGIGLGVTIWKVPGVPEAVIIYVQNNFIQTLLLAGIPAGLANFGYNFFFRKNVPNY